MKNDNVSTLIRTNLTDGHFSTIQNDTLSNKQLTDSGLRLLMLLLNQSKDWVINLTYFQHQLDWSQKKLAKTTKHLIQLGYLQKQKIRKEGKNGFKYEYTISESLICRTLICRNGNIRDGKVTNGNITFSNLPNRLVNNTNVSNPNLTNNKAAKHNLDKNNNIDEIPAKRDKLDFTENSHSAEDYWAEGESTGAYF